MTEPKGLVRSCVRGGLGYQEKVLPPESDWILEQAPQWSLHQSESSGSFFTTLSGTWCHSWKWSRARPGAELDHFCGFLPTQDILWFNLNKLLLESFHHASHRVNILESFDQDLLMQTPLTSTVTCFNRELRKYLSTVLPKLGFTTLLKEVPTRHYTVVMQGVINS